MINETLNFRILVIDDNKSILEDFMKILNPTTESMDMIALDQLMFEEKQGYTKKLNFEILTASQGQEGFNIIEREMQAGFPIALAFVDMRMPPGWDGIETIKKIWSVDKNIQIVICTAYSDYSWEETVDSLGETDNLLILKKPFDNIAVRQLASALTKKWQLMNEMRTYTSSLENTVSERTLSLEKSLSLVKATFESTSDGILVVDSNRKIIDYNSILIKLLDIPSTIIETKDDVQLTEFLATQLNESPNKFLSKVECLYSQPDKVSIDELHFKNKRVFERYSQPQILDKKNIGRIWSYRDITQRANLESKLEFQALHDELTGLPNRRYLYQNIRKLIEDSRESIFAVLFLDLDRFKLINDSFSHATGDTLLQTVSKRLQEIIRGNDILARIGGDEFVIILSALSKESDITKIVNKILESLAAPFQIDTHEAIITTSIGISFYPRDGNNSDTLLKKSDIAMYYAKQNGANQYKIYVDSLNQESLSRLDHEADLCQALLKNEFFLVYQPQYDLYSEKIVATEALIRWQHPTKGVILPNDFIWLAEDNRLIIPIGQWVLETACAQNKAWQDEGLPPMRIAINVSEQQLTESFIESVKNVLQKTGLKAEYLEIEFTENIMINHPGIPDIIKQLKSLGVKIALDHFGTGYSSLTYLKSVKLDRLKFDRSMIKNIDTQQDDKVIINAIAMMAIDLGIEVLVEGVELPTQVSFLKETACLQVQGYYYSKPMPPNDIKKIIKSSK